VDKAL